MAEFKMNKMADGASGKVGRMVFKQVGRRTLYTQAPTFTKPPTANQVRHRERFRRVALFAMTVLQDTAVKEAYAKSVEGIEFNNAFTAAVSDYLKAPVVERIDATGYHGNAGDLIVLSVSDSFKVENILVTITLPDSTVIESGLADHMASTAEWQYRVTNINAAFAGSKINVVVTDKPGNFRMFEKVM